MTGGERYERIFSGHNRGGQTEVPVSETEIITPFIKNILELSTPEAFSDADIPREELQMIARAGIYAPSGHNCQTWKFTVIRRGSEIEALENIVQKVTAEKEIKFDGFRSPGALILLSNDRRNPYGIQDVSCAAQNMMLAAGSYGIASLLTNPLKDISDETKIRSRLDSYGVPGEHIVWICVALGYAEETKGSYCRKENAVIHIR